MGRARAATRPAIASATAAVDSTLRSSRSGNHEHQPERDQGRSDDQTESECSASKGVRLLLLADSQLSRDFTRDCELHRAGGKDDEGQQAEQRSESAVVVASEHSARGEQEDVVEADRHDRCRREESTAPDSTWGCTGGRAVSHVSGFVQVGSRGYSHQPTRVAAAVDYDLRGIVAWAIFGGRSRRRGRAPEALAHETAPGCRLGSRLIGWWLAAPPNASTDGHPAETRSGYASPRASSSTDPRRALEDGGNTRVPSPTEAPWWRACASRCSSGRAWRCCRSARAAQVR